ncbi:hypothetical protein [Domibacillus mangrovi]|uniref:IDEAL domain-containing protein n=1 Tax=Domibacillus mangrovi TaxID=1714354 RepID=A0A1Q5P6I7_9BACI|nr:hypothetical protein [Domibacillus mangrovi]OKL37788.1 hypothetical protein BLL40_02900 [Domibacillus mangrovi]
MLRSGDWIIAQIDNYHVIGFIESISVARNEVFITKVANYVEGVTHSVKPTPKLFTVDRVGKLNLTLEKEDWDSLIDLAIHTGDERWFDQLAERMLLDVQEKVKTPSTHSPFKPNDLCSGSM